MSAEVTDKRRAQDIIDDMVRRIAERFQPEKVILFGSYARGTAGPDSDVDLLVIMAVTGSMWRLPKRWKSTAGFRARSFGPPCWRAKCSMNEPPELLEVVQRYEPVKARPHESPTTSYRLQAMGREG